MAISSLAAIELAQDRALAHDLGVAAHVGRARHALRQRVQVGQAAAVLGLAEALQLLEDGDHVGRLAGVDQRADGGVDQPVLVAVEVAVGQQVAGAVPGAVVEQQAAEHALFGLDRVRRHAQPGDLVVARRRAPGSRESKMADMAFDHRAAMRPVACAQACGQPVAQLWKSRSLRAGPQMKKGRRSRPFASQRRQSPSVRLRRPPAPLTSTTTSVCGDDRHGVLADGLQRAVGHAHLRLRDLEADACSAPSAMSALVTEPNRRPSTPAFCADVHRLAGQLLAAAPARRPACRRRPSRVRRACPRIP